MAQKIVLQHWLEAIDPCHRYDHNLHLYYDILCASSSCKPFFYWLDVGKGRDLHHQKCPRSKLNSQLIMYLGPDGTVAPMELDGVIRLDWVWMGWMDSLLMLK
ncbi:IQ domain-containing protein IQM1 [Zea mays]|uniref:IQ domain-containing protein IQM1 n=1 Tax=Zea mays TaxID=4577 RepID=A0A3L6DWY1_MAIZE|nr:IQ domain-containing protein IQM1 [Zea mays]